MTTFIKQTLLAIIAIIPAFSYAITFQDLRQKVALTTYKTGVFAIDKTADMLSDTAVHVIHAAHKIRGKKIDYQFYEDIAQRCIKHIQNGLLQQEQKIITDIYNEFNITTDQQKGITWLVNCLKEYEKNFMSQSQPHKEIQDNDCDERILNLFKKTNINPNSNMKYVISDVPSDKGVGAAAICLRAQFHVEEDTLKITDVANPPTIIFYPKFFNASKKKQLAVLLHELTHIYLQHGIIKGNITIGISHFAGVSPEQIHVSKNWKKLVNNHERQAEILNKNPESASLMRYSNSKSYYPDELFLGHYKQLTVIDELHKFTEKLKNYKTKTV